MQTSSAQAGADAARGAQEDAFRTRYDRFMDWLRDRILAADRLDDALLLAAWYGAIRSDNFDGVYFDDAVEEKVRDLYLAERPEAARTARTGPASGVALVASTLYDTGGHTPICMKWLQAKPLGLPHKLLVTRSMTARNRAALQAIGCELVECPPQLARTIDTLLAGCAEAGIVVLVTDPDDIAAAVAARILRESGRLVVFYNHADHRFSYGIRAADVVAEISHFGQNLNRRTHRVARQGCWLGIPVDELPASPLANPHRTRAARGRTIMAGGAAWKFDPADGLFFGDFVDALLAREPDATVWLVGPDPSSPPWREQARRWGSRVVFKGLLPRADYLEALSRADVFVDSFPVCGGTAFSEAVLSGAPCTGLTTGMSGYSACDSLRVPTVPALVDRVQALLAGSPQHVVQVRAAREALGAQQSLAAFVARIEMLYRGDRAHCPIPYPDPSDGDSQWFERAWTRGRRAGIATAGALARMRPGLRWKAVAHALPLWAWLRPANALDMLWTAVRGGRAPR